MLEHMAFKGTKRRSARQIAEEMDMVGGNMNAYTSLENTVYYTRVMARDVPLAVDMLGDILQHSIFDKEELERERHVILQEIAMHNDTPDDLVFDYFSETAYPNQPLGRSILGKPELVSAHTSKDLSRYMGKHYHTRNMVVTAAGNVDHKAFLKLVGEHFDELPANTHPPATKAKYKGGDRRVKRKFEQLHLAMGFEGASYHDDDYYIWQVLSILLGGGMSSRLFQEVREKRGLAYTVQSFLSSHTDSGMLAIYAATNESKTAEMVPVICDEVMKLQKGVNKAELKRAKNQIKASLFMSRESTSSIAEWIGRHLINYNRYKPATEIAKLVDAVTADDIMRTAKSISGKNLTLAALGPQKGLPGYDKVRGWLG
jgi:predicted Zn-dependent peptidase